MTRTGMLRRLVIAGTAASMLALTACGSASSGPKSDAATGDTTVRVGITSATAPPTFLVLIADKLGILQKKHIAVKYVTLSPNVTAQALASNSVDILAAPSVETAMLNGQQFKIFAGAAKSYWAVYAKNGISDWTALKGKKVGLPCGQAATCHSFMLDVLAAHGLDANSVTFIYGTAQGNYESLAAGSVDAALTTAPYTYSLETGGKTKALDISDTKAYLSTQFTATASFINSHAALITNFADAMNESKDALTKLPVDPKILDVINNFESQNGIDPATLDQNRFLTDFANNNSWQIVPTRELITEDLALLAAIPELHASATKATFDDLVHPLPMFEAQYG